MRESFHDLPLRSRVFTIALTLAYLASVALILPYNRPLVVAALAIIFAATGLVQPLPNPTGGQIFPTNSVKIVVALLWQPPEVLIGTGIGSFVGLLLFRRNEVWRAALNGAAWGLSTGVAALAAQLVFRSMQPGLVSLIVAGLMAVATNRVINEGIFSVYRAQRFGRPLLPDWLQNVSDQWFSQVLAASMAIVLAAAAARIDTLWSAIALTSIAAIALPIPRQELAYYYRAQQMMSEIVEAMVRALEGIDPNARAHGDRVSALTAAVGRRLGMSERHLRTMLLASRLHDVGMLSGPDGASAEAHHAAVGGRILSRLPDPMIAAIVRAHHERWDGKGLPDEKKGETIPLGARILAATEIYDSAIAGLAPFEAPLTRQAAFSYLISLAGTVLDPKIVIALLAVASEQEAKTGTAE